MRFTDKLIATLKKAYENYSLHKNRQYLDLKELMNAADIITDHEEVVNLGKRLEGDGLVIFHLKYGKNGTPHIYLTSEGIDKCESGTLFDVEVQVQQALEENSADLSIAETPPAIIEKSTEDSARATMDVFISPIVDTPVQDQKHTEKSNTIIVPDILEMTINKPAPVNSETATTPLVATETMKNATSLRLLLQEIKIAASLNEDLRVREVKELLERIEELTVYINVQQRIPKYGFLDFLQAINKIEPMHNFKLSLNNYLA